MKLPDAQVRKPRRPEDIDHLSHSSMSSYLRCPRQFAYSYLEGLRRAPGVALVKGKSVDIAMTHNLEQKIESHNDLPKEEVLEVAEDSFRKSVDEEGGASEIDWGGDRNAARALDSTIGMTDIHMMHHSPHIQPMAVQLEVHRELPDGRDFMGFIDFVETDGTVGDWKTGAKRMGQAAADNDQQPAAYAYLIGEPIAFEFVRAIDTGTHRLAEIVETGRDAAAIAWFETAATEVSSAINAGIYPPRTDWWGCVPKYCGFYQMCRIEGRMPRIG